MRNPIVLTILNSDDAIINKQNQPSLISTSLRYPILALTRQAEKNATATRQSPRLLEVPSVCCLLFAKILLRIVFFTSKQNLSKMLYKTLPKKTNTHFAGFFLVYLSIYGYKLQKDWPHQLSRPEKPLRFAYGDRISIFSSYPFQVSLRMKVGTHTYCMISYIYTAYIQHISIYIYIMYV
jgi:hypothetical protein